MSLSPFLPFPFNGRSVSVQPHPISPSPIMFGGQSSSSSSSDTTTTAAVTQLSAWKEEEVHSSNASSLRPDCVTVVSPSSSPFLPQSAKIWPPDGLNKKSLWLLLISPPPFGFPYPPPFPSQIGPSFVPPSSPQGRRGEREEPHVYTCAHSFFPPRLSRPPPPPKRHRRRRLPGGARVRYSV